MIAWAACRLFAFRLIVGLGMAGEYSASATYVLESWPRRIRNKASAFLLTGYTVGSLVVALIYPFMISHFGWRSLFFLGILPVFLTIYRPTNLRESAEFEEARQKGETATGVSFLS